MSNTRPKSAASHRQLPVRLILEEGKSAEEPLVATYRAHVARAGMKLVISVALLTLESA